MSSLLDISSVIFKQVRQLASIEEFLSDKGLSSIRKYGEKNLKEGGLKIYSTLDWEKQKLAEKIIENKCNLIQKYNGIAQDLSFEDLTHAVNEMVARVEGRFTPTLKQIQLQDLLRRKLTARSKLQPSEGYFPIRAEFATRFLIQNPNFLD